MKLALHPWSSSVQSILSVALSEDLALTRGQNRLRVGDAADSINRLRSEDAAVLFQNAREPEAARSGLLLRLGDWEGSHNVAQEVSSTAGSYWHGIAHRMEPDDFNAGYWFRRVGQHPIFPDLREAAAAVLEGKPAIDWQLGTKWDPSLFIEWCSEARSSSNPDLSLTAQTIQGIEWTLLFQWCVEPAK